VALADMTDFARMDAIFTRFQPEIVFHAAAYKHVPLMEHHPGEAIKNIIGATKNIVDLSLKHEVDSLVMISTDKAVNPTSVMGCCKRVAELYVQAAARQFTRRFVTVRFGNVLGSAGSVIPFFRQQIAKGGPVTVTHPDMTRFFMTIPEASQLVIQAGALGKGGEIFVLDMGSAVRILDLAEDLIRLSGLRPGVDIDIQISGLRPGEKLYEELYTDDEQQQPTRHPKILTAESERMVYMNVLRHIRDLLDLAESSPEDIRSSLAQVVPRYRGVTRKAQAA
jgi:FlaA1/EpsC-like NDP-sugar epimerase